MVKTNKQKTIFYVGMIVWLSLFMLVSISCKNPTGPDKNSTANIIVINDCGVALDIYMDGNLQSSVEYLDSITISNVSLELHELVAKKKGTETEIMSLSVELFDAINYEWTIQSSASLQISNEYGETLSIYIDSDLIEDIDDQSVILFEHFPYGEHLLEAVRPSDEVKVASTTVDVEESITYSWIISK